MKRVLLTGMSCDYEIRTTAPLGDVVTAVLRLTGAWTRQPCDADIRGVGRALTAAALGSCPGRGG